MIENNVCAIFVTFHPPAEVIGNIAKLRLQVQGMVVVDNGSSGCQLERLRTHRQELSFDLIENGENLGIAAALNIGVHWALSRKFEWVVLSDQDSTVTDGFIGAMLLEFNGSATADPIAIVIPKYVDRCSGKGMPQQQVGEEIQVAPTSGSLIPLSIFQRFGYFEESLIIDGVDYEFCLRVRASGFHVVSCPLAVLIHSLGEMREHGVFGKRLFSTTHHNAKRRYYITRNRIWIIRRYWKAFPSWCLKTCIATLKDCIKILLVETPRWEKLKNTFLGIKDGVLGRTGKIIEL